MFSDPPGPNVVEVSVFGPGFGESVLIHLGYNNWIIVDSCVDRSDGQSPALRYLEEANVDVARDVRLIVASHAHDDHTAGMSTLVERCSSAVFVCSSALTTEEFFKTVSLDKRLELLVRQSAYSEFRKIFQLVRQGGRSGGREIWRAFPTRELFSSKPAKDFSIRVVSLSPSDHAVTRSIDALARHVASQSGNRRKLSSFDPNEASVAIWIEAGGKSILLGADMLNGPNRCGWSAVLQMMDTVSEQKASLYKVAHHGSPNSDNDEIWQRMITDNPIALITPFWNGSVRLPSLNDRGRLCGRTRSAYISAYQEPKVTKRVKQVGAQLSQVASNVRPVPTRCGHIRVRSAVGEDDWQVEVLAPSRSLCGFSSARR
jgi:beta-lactamase superfamily II metal-dependent hydrolase